MKVIKLYDGNQKKSKFIKLIPCAKDTSFGFQHRGFIYKD